MGTSENRVGRGLGGADRDRTDDLLNAIQALSQLSYSPTRGPRLYVALAGVSTNPSTTEGYASERHSVGRLGTASASINMLEGPIDTPNRGFLSQQGDGGIDRWRNGSA
jgi:hypothetical protein